MENNTKQRIQTLLDTMDVPEKRKELEPNDIKWLLRNLFIHNSDNPHFSETIRLLKTLANPRDLVIE